MVPEVNIAREMNLEQDNKQLQRVKSLMEKEKYAEACLLIDGLIPKYPDNPTLFYLAGTCQINGNDHLSALGNFLKANELDPENIEYRNCIAKSIAMNGHHTLAIKKFETILETDPNNLESLGWLGYIYVNTGNEESAIPYLQRAIQLQPSNDYNHSNLALALGRQGQYEEALEHINKALRAMPKNAIYHKILGDIHRINGKINESLAAYTKAIDLNPKNIQIYYEIASTAKFKDPDHSIIKKMEKSLGDGMLAVERRYIHYGLGDAYHHCQQWDKAFYHYQMANKLVISKFNPKANQKFFNNVIKLYNPKYFSRLSVSPEKKITPIFIVGMPRSGSTLIDQVLVSHSRVDSIGESHDIPEIVNAISKEYSNKLEYPNSFANITPEVIEKYSQQCQENFLQKTLNAEFVVDKMLFNFYYLGLIAQLFPHAKIIHTVRSPLDTALSCYFTGFTASEELWAHNLESIGNFYRQYMRVMRHWKNVLPIPILDVRYEDMVADLETNAKRIVEFCGLDWEPGCLEFYNTKRSVVTASVVQVRQPIYSSSVERWKPYAKHLQPLVTALGNLLKDDTERLQEFDLKVNSPSGFIKRVGSYFQS